MISNNDFRPVSLDDRDLFIRQYAQFPQVHSDNTFTNMVCWNHYAHYTFAHVHSCILLASTIEGKTRYRPPIGPHDPALLREVMQLALDGDDDLPMVVLDPVSREWIKSLFPDLTLYPERNYFEYVYRTDDLADLPGRNYLNIRHQLNKFTRNCGPVIEPVTPKNLKDVRDFLIQWCEWKNCEGEPILAHEKEAVLYAISHFSSLKMSGLAIRVHERIGAVALYEELNADTVLVHFEKGLPDCEGIYKAINTETARTLKDRFEYINRESDMGVEGLREAKMRYHPHHMVEVHYIKRDELCQII